jgi:hypothetical protein
MFTKLLFTAVVFGICAPAFAEGESSSRKIYDGYEELANYCIGKPCGKLISFEDVEYRGVKKKVIAVTTPLGVERLHLGGGSGFEVCHFENCPSGCVEWCEVR